MSKKLPSLDQLAIKREELLDKILNRGYLPGEFRTGKGAIYQELRIVHWQIRMCQDSKNERAEEYSKYISDAKKKLASEG